MSQERATQREVKAHDGRLLSLEISGDRQGSPVFLLHGTPGSRNGPKPRGSVLYRLGVQLVCYDRPGYGGSVRHEGRTVAGAARDVEAIADALDLERFAVVGRSGGGPHALACAALLGMRVARTAVLVGVAPADAPGLDWYGGMVDDNVNEYTAADADPAALAEQLKRRAEGTVHDPESLVRRLRAQMTGPDKRVVDDVAIRRLLAATYSEALRDGPYGWIDDVFALRGDWGFKLEAIKGPMRFWHGADDNFSPVSHTRWLAAQIPHAQIQVQPGTAHFGAVEILPQMIPWLTGWHRDLVGADTAPAPADQPAPAGPLTLAY